MFALTPGPLAMGPGVSALENNEKNIKENQCFPKV